MWCASETLSFGLSRLYAAQAVAGNDLSLANRGVLLARADPESYRARATVFAEQKRFSEATVDLTQALTLSPHDGELWIQLGDILAQRGDTTSALTAYAEATRVVPYKARAHWLLGNCLLKAGRLEEAFVELHWASAIVPSLFPQALELAWQSYHGEPEAIERSLKPQTVHERIALAMFFGEHGRPDKAAPMMKAAALLPEDERAILLRELLEADRFEEAYQVWWSGIVKTDTTTHDGKPSIANGGFEDEIVLNDRGFGWQFPQGFATVSASLDVNEAHSGKQSLRLDWHGEPDHSSRVVQQLVLVAPEARYHLNFSARTESLTTNCGPLITVIDPKATERSPLAQSSALPQNSEWRDYTLEFTTRDTTKVIFIGITRQGSDGPCPIFGTTWLDDFSLVKN